MRSNCRLPRSGKALSAVLAGVALLAGAQAASAQSSAHPEAGVLRLPNVRVELAGQGRLTDTLRPGSQAGFRAYIDPVTGELRDQTPEEAAEGGLAKAAKGAKSAPATFSLPGGGIGVTLDESHMANAVVVKNADGTLSMQCVTGSKAASEVLNGKAGKAHRHDH
jgi:hypothetical protein